MPLTDFFRINLPYGIQKNSSNEWFAFNREYVPIGWTSTKNQKSISLDNVYNEIPIYTKYKGITEAKLLKIAYDSENGVTRNEKGEIEAIFLYNDATNPQSTPKHWGIYFDKIKILSKFEKAL